MAGVTIESLIVNLSAGRLGSETYTATVELSGHAVEEVVWTGGDVHIYDNHREQVMTQLARTSPGPSIPWLRAATACCASSGPGTARTASSRC